VCDQGPTSDDGLAALVGRHLLPLAAVDMLLARDARARLSG
jgi:hypothetical protein